MDGIINIWELGTRINVKVNKEFIDYINYKIKEKFRTKRRVHKELIKHYYIPLSTFKDRLKRGYSYFIDLEILLKLCELLHISRNDFQSNIVAYKSRRGCNSIEMPKLPIKITPIFDMLIAHHIGDGCVVNPKNGRKPYFSYRQYNDFYKMSYISKIESIFGKLKYKSSYYNNAKCTEVYFPIACSELMFNLYNLGVDDFKSEVARIPKEILSKPAEYQLAFLIGIVIDEGHVDSDNIVIGMKNRGIIGDLGKICSNLHYQHSISSRQDGMFTLYILSEGLKIFYRDYQRILKEYPEVSLGYKETKIKDFILRTTKPKIYIPGNKNRLLNELSGKYLTVNEMAIILNMTRQGAKYLTNELIKEGKIQVKSTVKFNNYKYGLVD